MSKTKAVSDPKQDNWEWYVTIDGPLEIRTRPQGNLIGTVSCDLEGGMDPHAVASIVACAPELYRALRFTMDRDGMISDRDKAHVLLLLARAEGKE